MLLKKESDLNWKFTKKPTSTYNKKTCKKKKHYTKKITRKKNSVKENKKNIMRCVALYCKELEA